MDIGYYQMRYETMINRRAQTWKIIDHEDSASDWFTKRPSTHQWSIDELFRHMIANEVRYLQIPIRSEISQPPMAVRAQWVGNILFRLEETEHRSVDEVRTKLEEIQSVSREILKNIAEEDLIREKNAPWGEKILYGEMLSDLFDHDQFHHGKIHTLITYFRGPPSFIDPPNDIEFG